MSGPCPGGESPELSSGNYYYLLLLLLGIIDFGSLAEGVGQIEQQCLPGFTLNSVGAGSQSGRQSGERGGRRGGQGSDRVPHCGMWTFLEACVSRCQTLSIFRLSTV